MDNNVYENCQWLIVFINNYQLPITHIGTWSTFIKHIHHYLLTSFPLDKTRSNSAKIVAYLLREFRFRQCINGYFLIKDIMKCRINPAISSHKINRLRGVKIDDKEGKETISTRPRKEKNGVSIR